MYLDNAATTPPFPEVLKVMEEAYKEYWGNPSSVHDEGKKAKKRLEVARETISQLVMKKPKSDCIYFTSGGTEGNNWAIESAARIGEKKGKKTILTTAIEHHSVLHKMEELKQRGFDVVMLKPDMTGSVDAGVVEDHINAMKDDLALVSIMHVNNETGVVQPIWSIGAMCNEYDILFHVDGVQGTPHFILTLDTMGVDYYTASAHKFNGPRGVGFLYARRKSTLSPLLYGGAQEKHLRAGTENLAGIVGMETALVKTFESFHCPCEAMPPEVMSPEEAKKEIYDVIKRYGGRVNGVSGSGCLSTIINFYIPGINGETLMNYLNLGGVYVSAGSACTAGDPTPSHVLVAMGLNNEQASNSIRISLPVRVNAEQFRTTLQFIENAIKFLR